MPFHGNIIILPCFRIGDMCVTRDEEGNVTFGLSEAEQETPLDFGSPEKNEYVLQNIGTAFRYVDVFDQEYMAMVLSEVFSPPARPLEHRPAVIRRVRL
jgi:hypothetical protein